MVGSVDSATVLTDDRRRRTLAVSVCLIAYPLAVMWRVLAWNGHRRLQDLSDDPDALTDLDGAFRIAQLLRDMRWPWSTSMGSGLPDGEGLIRWQAISQGIQFGTIYVFTRVAPPVFSVNLLITIGWFTTGVAVYLLGRRLSLSPLLAVVAAVAAQMLPILPRMGANFTTYVFIGVPIYVVCRAIDAATEPGARNLVWLAAALGFTFFFDPYWFLFSSAAVAVVFLVQARTIWMWLREGPRWGRLLAAAVVLLPLLLMVVLLTATGSGSGSGSSRPVSVATSDFVDASLRTPLTWFHSTTDGVGLLIGLLGLVTAAWSLARRSDPKTTSAASVVVLMALLSTRTRIATPWFTIESLALYARHVMPGVRFFGRAALVAEAMLCVFAVIGAAELWRRSAAWRARTDWRERVALGAVVIVAIGAMVELSPTRRPINDRWEDFAQMRAVLDENDSPVVLAVPFTRHGRDWLELSMFDGVGAVNQLYLTTREELTAIAASRGPEAFAGYLRSLGTTHLLVVEGAGGYPLTYGLAATSFVRRATLELDSYGNPRENLVLYEVHGDPADLEPCVDLCRIGAGLDLLEGVNVLRELDASPEQGLTGEVIARRGGWGMLDESIEMQISLRSFATIRYVARLGIQVENPCTDRRTVTITRAGTSETVELGPHESDVVELEITSDRSAEPAVVSTTGAPCDEGDEGRVTLFVGRPEILG